MNKHFNNMVNTKQGTDGQKLKKHVNLGDKLCVIFGRISLSGELCSSFGTFIRPCPRNKITVTVTVTTGWWTTESAAQAYLFADQQELIHGRLPQSCHMTRVAGTRLVLHVRTLVTSPFLKFTGAVMQNRTMITIRRTNNNIVFKSASESLVH